MKVSTSGLDQNSPARPLLLSQITYQGITDQLGNALGTTLQDTLCSTAGLQPSYAGLAIKLLGSDAAGQVRTINIHTLATGIIAIVDPWTDFNGAVYQIPAGTPFVILSALSNGGGGFQEQADVTVDITAINAGETDVFDLNVAATHYIVRSLRLKCADPGVNTITVRLYELVNDVSLEVDSFEITTANFATYHSLMDMFGLAHLAGDDLQVTVRVDAGGPYAVTGQYSHGLAT